MSKPTDTQIGGDHYRKMAIQPSKFIQRNAQFALGRLRSGEMNKTETLYAKHLAALKMAGEVAWYHFEGITFKLAKDTRYTPDFSVMMVNGEMEFHEIKGFWQDDAKVKIKVAAKMFPFRFIALKVKPKKDGGGWIVEEF